MDRSRDRLTDKSSRIADALATSVERLDGRVVTLLFSSGYDSRCIFASLIKKAIDFKAAVWDIPNPIVEIERAHRICTDYSIELEVLDSHTINAEQMEDAILSFCTRVEGTLSASRSYLIPLLDRITEPEGSVLWGEGEIIRPPVRPSEYLNGNVLLLLSDEPEIHDLQKSHIFSNDLQYKEAFHETREKIADLLDLPFHERLALWLAFIAYPSIYDVYAKAVSEPAVSVLPFLDPGVVGAMLSDPLSLLEGTSWKRNIRILSNIRKLYAEVISRLDVGLLRYSTDRGYPPLLDRWGLGGIATAVGKTQGSRRSSTVSHLHSMQNRAMMKVAARIDLGTLVSSEVRDLLDLSESDSSGIDMYEMGKLISLAVGNTVLQG
ncbi:MAG: hypothetical protein JXK93_08535 [Sphaerochaetaceae bacterium]|nr:hypothetical protein [Sphaerochaetaceae bacterium]